MRIGFTGPGFRIRRHRKDGSLAVHSAWALGPALPSSALVEQLMNGVGRGDGELGHSGLIRTLRAMAT